VLLAAALLLAAASPVRADEAAGTPGEWLTQFTTARALGLGGAYVAAATDPLGALWNPAGLTLMDQDELCFENARLYEDTGINSLSLAVPGSRLPSFGVTMLALRSGDFQRTNELNDALGSFETGETAYLLTLAHGITPRLAVGANFKVVQQTVESSRGAGFGMDVGGIASVTRDLRVALAVANLGGPTITLRDAPETYATVVRGGLALSLFEGRGLVALQADHMKGLGTRLHAGTEYWILPTFGLRGGYSADGSSGGLSYRFAPRYQLDYAAADHPLGLTHRVGLSLRFGGFYASSQADPEAFSPTGERPVTRVALNARTKAESQQWALEIANKSETVVRRFGGRGKPPAHVEWDGKDETGLPLADGLYQYRLVVTDHDGRILTSPARAIEISTGGPEVRVPVVPTQ
jgi:hypothetical protein